jgi:hypothetical protein
MHVPMPPHDTLAELLETVLTRVEGPLAAAAVRKALPLGKKPALKDVQARLRALVDAGRVYLWPGKAEKFSAVEARTLAREQVRQALASGPATEGEVKKRVAKVVQSLVRTALTGLIAEGVVSRHPKLGKRLPYGLTPADPLDYLRPEVDAAIKKLRKLGFEEGDLRAAVRRLGGGVDAPAGTPARSGAAAVSGTGGRTGAATSAAPSTPPAAASPAPPSPGEADADAAILAAILRLNSQASRGALVYVADLRAALADRLRSKAAFDQAVLGLAERARVQLQSHAWPGRLSDAEREALIPNGRGGYFDAIGLRLE